jgi:hypothetical protein
MQLSDRHSDCYTALQEGYRTGVCQPSAVVARQMDRDCLWRQQTFAAADVLLDEYSHLEGTQM